MYGARIVLTLALVIVSVANGFDYPKSPPNVAPTVSERACQRIIESFVPIRRARILGGEVASIGEFPHMVAVGLETILSPGQYIFFCSGSLLSSTFVLSSAFCGQAANRKKSALARVGVVDISGTKFNPSTDFVISDAIVHPNFTDDPNHTGVHHDISLLRLKDAVRFNGLVHPACLFIKKDNPKIPLTVSGWGRASNDRAESTSLLLMKLELPILDEKKCILELLKGKNESYLTKDHICTRDPGETRDTCEGDSGAPLQGLTSKSDGQYRLVGITSFGAHKCGSGTVYTRISSYRYWIEDIVWPVQDVLNRIQDKVKIYDNRTIWA